MKGEQIGLYGPVTGLSEGGSVDPEQIAEAVEDYLTENPPTGSELYVEDYTVKIRGVTDTGGEG